ncbi:MAG: hypothetical protein IKG44_05795 [Mogibacterium sp.]|nr:hypothetical protein [Mogibacterium sp.]
MSIYKDQIEQMVYEQKKMLEKYTRECEILADGNLASCINHGKATYYHTFIDNGRYKRTSLSKDPNTLKSLARREYLSLSIKALENNIKVLEKAEKAMMAGDIDHLKELMQKAYRGLPDEYFFGSGTGAGSIYQFAGAEEATKRHIDWGKEPYEKSTYRPEKLRLPTSAGYKVRSKSEQHIVEQLVNYGVPHRYEQILRIGEDVTAPDFTFRSWSFELFYWEHAGMMDDPYYQARHKRKMVLMERAGIVPWKNLIVTYDNDGVINVPLIKSIIENDVIPRL